MTGGGVALWEGGLGAAKEAAGCCCVGGGGAMDFVFVRKGGGLVCECCAAGEGATVLVPALTGAGPWEGLCAARLLGCGFGAGGGGAMALTFVCADGGVCTGKLAV